MSGLRWHPAWRVAAWGAGAVRTASDNYLTAFVAVGLLCLVASAAVPFIGIGLRGAIRSAGGSEVCEPG